MQSMYYSMYVWFLRHDRDDRNRLKDQASPNDRSKHPLKIEICSHWNEMKIYWFDDSDKVKAFCCYAQIQVAWTIICIYKSSSRQKIFRMHFCMRHNWHGNHWYISKMLCILTVQHSYNDDKNVFKNGLDVHIIWIRFEFVIVLFVVIWCSPATYTEKETWAHAAL